MSLRDHSIIGIQPGAHQMAGSNMGQTDQGAPPTGPPSLATLLDELENQVEKVDIKLTELTAGLTAQSVSQFMGIDFPSDAQVSPEPQPGVMARVERVTKKLRQAGNTLSLLGNTVGST